MDRIRLKEGDGRVVGTVYRRFLKWWLDARVRGVRIQRALGTDDVGEAEVLARRQIEKFAPLPPKQAARVVKSVEWAVAQYFERHAKPPRIKASTVRRYHDAIDQFVALVGADLPIRSVARADLVAFQQALTEKCVNVVVNNTIGAVRAWLNWLRAEDIYPVEKDPTFKLRPLPVNRTAKEGLTEDEVRMLLEAVDADPFIRDFTIMGLETGMRPSEILHVRGIDYDEREHLLHLRAWGTWTLKDHQDRTIQLNSAAAEIAARRKLASGDHELPLFAGRGGVARIEDNVRKDFKALLPASLKTVVPYDLRHTFATRALENGWSIEQIADYLGHSDPRMTKQFYAARLNARTIGAPPIFSKKLAYTP